jgi:Major Facilitator Superfamily
MVLAGHSHPSVRAQSYEHNRRPPSSSAGEAAPREGARVLHVPRGGFAGSPPLAFSGIRFGPPTSIPGATVARSSRQRGSIREVVAEPAVRVAIGVTITIMLGFGLIVPTLPLFAKSFGAGRAEVGLLNTASGVTRLVFDLVAGPLADRYGKRTMATLGSAVTPGVGRPVRVRRGHGMGRAGRRPVPVRRRRRASSWVRPWPAWSPRRPGSRRRSWWSRSLCWWFSWWLCGSPRPSPAEGGTLEVSVGSMP